MQRALTFLITTIFATEPVAFIATLFGVAA
jgi:hypothetical protein